MLPLGHISLLGYHLTKLQVGGASALSKCNDYRIRKSVSDQASLYSKRDGSKNADKERTETFWGNPRITDPFLEIWKYRNYRNLSQTALS